MAVTVGKIGTPADSSQGTRQTRDVLLRRGQLQTPPCTTYTPQTYHRHTHDRHTHCRNASSTPSTQLTQLHRETWRELHVHELTQLVEMLVRHNDLQDVQQLDHLYGALLGLGAEQPAHKLISTSVTSGRQRGIPLHTSHLNTHTTEIVAL